MEQPALLSIVRTDTSYRFRLDLPDGPTVVGQEYSTDLTVEMRERLRRALQSATLSMRTMATTDLKRQTTKLGAVNDALLTLGRFLFEVLLPGPLQEALRRLEVPLLLSANTPDIPWELMFDSSAKPGRYLSHATAIGRLPGGSRDHERDLHQISSMPERPTRKLGKREAQGLSILFLVNPTGDRSAADEEVAALCTNLPESISRIILYRQNANQLEMRMRISSEQPHVLHYAGPLPPGTGNNEPALALAGNSRLDSHAGEQLFQALPKRPLIFLSYHED